MPSKLTGMLSSGRPVVAGARAETELGKVVSECGVAVPPDDAKAFAAAVVALTLQPELRRELGRRSRAYAEARFDRDAVLAQFERDLQACVARMAHRPAT
jgi:colanic acid biosynthesis glycosyl transferase WcaI